MVERKRGGGGRDEEPGQVGASILQPGADGGCLPPVDMPPLLSLSLFPSHWPSLAVIR